MMWFKREQTTDEQIALRVRKAVAEYNAAITEAENANLIVSCRSKFVSGYSNEYLGRNRVITVSGITRTNTRSF